MNNQQNNFEEVVRRTFTWRRSALHEIHYAIGRAKRRPKSAIRVDYTAMPERKTWYECARCGSEAYREDNHGRHCRLCGSAVGQREWVRPDIAQAEERARRRRAQFTWVGTGPGGGRARDAEITDANPWKPLPDGDYRILRKTRGPG
jgi:ribosomal protein L37E